jgi:hypothetical protein
MKAVHLVSMPKARQPPNAADHTMFEKFSDRISV